MIPAIYSNTCFPFINSFSRAWFHKAPFSADKAFLCPGRCPPGSVHPCSLTTTLGAVVLDHKDPRLGEGLFFPERQAFWSIRKRLLALIPIWEFSWIKWTWISKLQHHCAPCYFLQGSFLKRRENLNWIEFWRLFSIFIERIVLSQDFVGVYSPLSVLKLLYFCLDSWRGQELESKVVSLLKSLVCLNT